MVSGLEVWLFMPGKYYMPGKYKSIRAPQVSDFYSRIHPLQHWHLIVQALAFRALDGEVAALGVAQFSTVPAEIEFSAVAVHVLLAEVVERPLHAPLEQEKNDSVVLVVMISTSPFSLMRRRAYSSLLWFTVW